MNTLRPVEVSEYYIQRISKGMQKYFWDNIFKQIFDILKDNNSVYNYNPYHDEKGRFCGTIMAKMPKTFDYNNPTKDYELSPIPTEFLNKLGKIQKPLVLKKNIIEKNKKHHPEIDVIEYNDILLNGIYKADVIFKTSPNDENFNFVHYGDNHHPQVLIELSETKNNYEIVNFYWLRDKSLKEKLNKAIKRADNEGDQVLIDNEKFSKVGGLSNLETDSIIIINYIKPNFNPTVNNSKDDLINAIRTGKVWYENGAFRTKTRFPNSIAIVLEKMGAKFVRGSYVIEQTKIPMAYINAMNYAKAHMGYIGSRISDFLLGLDGLLAKVTLEQYVGSTVDLAFKKLQLDIVKSAQEKKVPVIELGIVQPNIKVPKQKTKEIEVYWKEYDKKAEKLNKEILKAKKDGEEPEALKAQLKELRKEAYTQAPSYDVKIDDIELNEQTKKITEDYVYNLKYWVKKWEAKNIVKMRQDVADMVQKGYRVPAIQEYFEKRWKKVAKDKANFLVVNESHLAGSVIKATSYQELGCNSFVWGRSSSKEKRKLHEEYYGETFTFDNPPIIDEKLGITGLPRQIWNCKCHMLIKPPTLAEIMDKAEEVRNAKRNIFKRLFNSKQCNNTAWRYRRFGQGQTF